MTKQGIIDGIDSMRICEKDYDTLNMLCDYLDDSVFSKIMELILEGDLKISDFEPVFSDSAIGKAIAESIETQNELYTEMSRLAEFRAATDIQKYGIVKGDSGYMDEKTEEINNILFSLVSQSSTGDPITDACRKKLYSDLLSGAISAGDASHWLMSINDYVIPVDYDHIVLNQVDIDFMNRNDLSVEGIKKIKSLAEYLRLPKD
jgi:hypothetical protein